MLVSTKSEEQTINTHQNSEKRRETKAQIKTTLFKMKLKKQVVKQQEIMASPIMKQITGKR